jgi:lipopolysaccharide export system protein LptC
MTSTVDELGARGFTASSRPDNQKIFLRAKRHSRVVRMLRIAVPLGTVLVLAAITLVSWLDPMRILARLPTAKLETRDRTPINVTAVNGIYNRKSGILKLDRDVLLTTPSYEVNLMEAVLDTTANTIVSDKPVQVKMLQGVVNAQRLEVSGGGEVVRFGDVKMTLTGMPDLGANRPGGR